jgi:opacity protein-like surface antigen
MKKGFVSCVAIAALMVFLSAGSVFAAENGKTGFYIGISGGYVIPQTMTISDPDDSSQKFDATLENGYLVGVKSGWNTPFTKRIMALEFEYNYIRNNFDNSKIIPDIMGNGSGTIDGTIGIHAFLFNVKARYPEGPIHPYAGAGLGWSIVQLGDLTIRGDAGPGIKGDIGNGFCWQLLVGVDFDITPNIAVGIGYKYLATNTTIGSKRESDDRIYIDADYRASIVTVGLTFLF